MLIRYSVVAALLCSIVNLSAFDGDLWRAPRKKIIEFGWDRPSPAYLKKNIAVMEKYTAYDGVGVEPTPCKVTLNGKSVWIRPAHIFDVVPLQYAWLKQDVEDLRATAFKQFTDNFLMLIGGKSKPFDWFDDQAWAIVTANAGVMAKVAKQGGMKGICLDFESYRRKRGWYFFRYNPQNGRSRQEIWHQARLRGRQFIQAIKREFPDAVLFCFHLFDYNFIAAEGDAPYTDAGDDRYHLLIPFWNGIFDEISSKMTVVDGCETPGYRSRNLADYCAAYFRIKRNMELLLSPANRVKALRQVQMGSALYVDAYFRKTEKWWITAPGMTQIEVFERNLGYALKVADEYCWTWSECAKWWPIKYDLKKRKQVIKSGDGLWRKAFPGIVAAMRRAKDPVKELADNAGKVKNLLQNGDFEQGAGSAVAHWNFWQSSFNPGGKINYVRDGFKSPTAIELADISFAASLLQQVPVKPGERYLIRAKSKSNLDFSPAVVTVRWRNKRKDWLRSVAPKVLASRPILNSEWRGHAGVVEVPPKALYMVILLNAGSQRADKDACRYDRIEVYNVKDLEKCR